LKPGDARRQPSLHVRRLATLGRVAAEAVLVDLDAKARAGRHLDLAVSDGEWVGQQILGEVVERLVELAAERDVLRGGDHVGAGDAGNAGLAHVAAVAGEAAGGGDRGDFAGAQHAAGFLRLDGDQVGHVVGGYLQGFGGGEDAFVGHDRGVERGGDGGQGGALVGWHGLFDEGGAEVLDVAQAADRLPRLHALVVVDADLGVVGEEVAEAGEAAEVLGVIGEAGLHFEQADAVREELADQVGVLGEVGVGDGKAEGDFVADATAEQVADRGAEGFADDVEQRHFHGGLGLGAVDDGAVGGGEQLLDAEGIGAEEDWAEVDVEGGCGGLGRAGEDGPGGGLAPASDAGVGVEAEDHVGAGGDVADAVGVDRSDGDAHRGDRDGGDADLGLGHAWAPCGLGGTGWEEPSRAGGCVNSVG
jgi:hypothetical protein